MMTQGLVLIDLLWQGLLLLNNRMRMLGLNEIVNVIRAAKY
jgi:hypothetical protein